MRMGTERGMAAEAKGGNEGRRLREGWVDICFLVDTLSGIRIVLSRIHGPCTRRDRPADRPRGPF